METVLKQMEDGKHLNRIAKYLSGNLSKSEEKKLMAWVNASDANQMFFEEMVQVWTMTADADDTLTVDTDSAWGRLDSVLDGPIQTIDNERTSAKVVQGAFRKKLMRVAAILLIGVSIGLGWMNFNKDNQPTIVEVSTQLLEQKEINLPDGSKVWLNGDSKLVYSNPFKDRLVQLEGEAFFEVERLSNGATFTITSGEATTQVLGTSFNVRAYPDEDQIEVAVESGKVSVQKNVGTAEKVTLEAGNAGIYLKSEQRLVKEEERDLNADSWKSQQLIFSDIKVEDMLPAMERHFKIKLEVANPKILNCYFEGGTYNQPKLEVLLAAMEFTMALAITNKDDVYVISGAGCD